MLVGMVWHGSGILSIPIIAWCIRCLRANLRGRKKATIGLTLALGIVIGFIGSIAGGLLFAYLPTTLDNYPAPYQDVVFAYRLCQAIVFIYMGAIPVGAIGGHLLRKYCPPEAILKISVLVATIMIVYPVFYGWGARLLRLIA